MLAQLLLLFATAKLALAENDHNYHSCYEETVKCPTTDSIKIDAKTIAEDGWPHYCFCNSASNNYQVTFDLTTTFSIPSEFFVRSRISAITIPDTCTGIGAGAFYGTTIGTITFGANAAPTISTDAFGEATFTGAVALPNTAKIADSAFYNTVFQSRLTLPNDMITITTYAFQHAEFKSDVIFPDSLKTISSHAFYYATFSQDVTLKSGVTQVDGFAFYYTTFQKALEFRNEATLISSNAFQNATFIGLLTLPAKYKMVSANTFESATFQAALTIPSEVKNINSKAFMYAKINGDLTLPASLENILGNAFQEAEIKGSVSFKNTKTKIVSEAFKQAVFSKTLVLPTGISKVESSSFISAVFEHSITFPSGLTEIAASAFKDAKFTDAIQLPDSLQNVRTSAFNGCEFSSDTSLTFGRYMSRIESTAFQNSNLQSIAFHSDAKLTTIGNKAFEGLFQLKVVKEQNKLYSENIDESAFEGDENIDFSSITSENIKEKAFRNCFNLVADKILILSDGNIKNFAFQNCQKLNSALTFQEKKETTKEPKSTIGEYAFQGTGISKLNLPHIAKISENAFENCLLLEGPSEDKYEELNVDTISSYAFNGDVLLHFTKITSKSIGTSSFQYCRNLGANIFLHGEKANVADYSFYSCDKLGTLTIDQSHLNDYQLVGDKDKISIPTYAFAKSGLSGKLLIPNSVDQINDYAFSNCKNIGEIEIKRQHNIPLTIGKYAFCSSNIGDELLIPRFVTQIQDYAFAKTSINKLTVEGTSFNTPKTGTRDSIEPSKTEIQTCAFADCSNLETVIFGNESIEIHDDSFRGCHLKSMTLGNINKIPDDAFIGMTEMVGNFDIPDSVTSIGDRAFSECYNIKSVTISNNSELTKIGKSAFYKCRGIESIVIPSKVVTIDSYSFYQCTNLKTITILSHANDDTDEEGNKNNGNILINDYAFYGCEKLTGTLTLPEGLSSIGIGAFQGCRDLGGSLTFPNSLTTIKERAFMGCEKLTDNLRFGVHVTTIGKYAFRDCIGLNGNLNITDSYDGQKSSQISIHEGAFYGCKNLKGDINLPLRCQLKENGADSKNVFKGCSGFDGQLIIPDVITTIPDGTFCDCSSINGQLKNNLKLIGNEAFRNCVKLTGSVDLSNYDYPKYIGSYAFANCTGLNGNLIFSDLSEVKLIKIGEYAFYNCVGLTGQLNCTNLNYVDKYAFAGCTGLTGPLNFGVNLHKVGAHAFDGCTGFSGTLSFISILNNELSIEESAFKDCTGFKDGRLLFSFDRSNIKAEERTTYYLKIEQNAFENTKFKDIRYLGRTQPDCDCDIGLPSRKGIHTSSNYEDNSFCGNPLHKSKLSGGAIAGIVIACIVVVAIIVALAVFFILKNKKNKDQSENEVEMNQDP